MKAALGATHFCADKDNLVLEDEGARMVLSVAGIEGVAQTIAAAAELADAGGGAALLLTGSGPLPVHELVTGEDEIHTVEVGHRRRLIPPSGF